MCVPLSTPPSPKFKGHMHSAIRQPIPLQPYRGKRLQVPVHGKRDKHVLLVSFEHHSARYFTRCGYRLPQCVWFREGKERVGSKAWAESTSCVNTNTGTPSLCPLGRTYHGQELKSVFVLAQANADESTIVIVLQHLEYGYALQSTDATSAQQSSNRRPRRLQTRHLGVAFVPRQLEFRRWAK